MITACCYDSPRTLSTSWHRIASPGASCTHLDVSHSSCWFIATSSWGWDTFCQEPKQIASRSPRLMDCLMHATTLPLRCILWRGPSRVRKRATSSKNQMLCPHRGVQHAQHQDQRDGEQIQNRRLQHQIANLTCYIVGLGPCCDVCPFGLTYQQVVVSWASHLGCNL